MEDLGKTQLSSPAPGGWTEMHTLIIFVGVQKYWQVFKIPITEQKCYI